jgi:predicted nucleotidyltransferase
MSRYTQLMATPLMGVIQSLNTAAVDYVVVGGLAVAAHGHPRATIDVDIIVRFDRQNVHRLVTCLTGLGFVPRTPVDPELLSDPTERASWKQRNMVALAFYDDQPPWTVVDVFIDHPIDYDQLLAQSVVIETQGVPMRVCGLLHLITLKEEANRPKDIEDLRWLHELLHRGNARDT